MKVLFAVSNEEISEAIVKKYQKNYKEIISYKNVYYFNAILKEIQKDKTYDRIVISEELEAFTHTQYDQIDKFIFEKLDSISDEASNMRGDDIPIILICSDRRTKSEEMLVKLFGIGIYNAILGNDRSVEEVCNLIYRPRSKKEAKEYYKMDSDEVKYQAENENDVSEQEIQNILAHYRKLGKNEDKYVASFNNIVAQYNDAQLRIISKFLPLNVRAVLEEKSPKYQQIMSFNNSVANSIRRKENEDLGPSEKLLKPKNKNVVMTEPIVIPSAVNTNNVKKLTRTKVQPEVKTSNMQVPTYNRQESNIEPDEDDMLESLMSKTSNVPVIPEPIVQEQPPKRRGRPRKTPIQENTIKTDETPKRRGRPRKNVTEQSNTLPGFEKVEDEVLPGFQKMEDTVLPGFEEEKEEIVPGFKNTNYSPSPLPGIEDNTPNNVLPGFEQEEKENTDVLPGFEEPTSIPQNNAYTNNYNNYNQTTQNTMTNNNSYSNYVDVTNVSGINNRQDFEPSQELARLLTSDKKVVTFVGTSKNGTSFIVNNLAEYASSIGINVAILDTTKNKNSYYIYTKNEEELRNIATNTLQNLSNGQAKGITVNRNLTVYTSLPTEREELNNAQNILETLVRNHSLVLIDCDFDTPFGYFSNAQEIYLVQTLDILTIQPLTAFLRELKAKNILDQNKIKIILNKYVKVRGISEKTIIGGMAFYNDPAMSFMTELFDRNTVKYMTIPFEQEIYTRYLESIINCDISIKGYSKAFIANLKELNNMVYSTPAGNNIYRPQGVQSYNNGFSASMNNTLNQMKRKY